MSDTFTLIDDTAEVEGDATRRPTSDSSSDTGLSTAPTGWQPSAQSTFSAGIRASTNAPEKKAPAATKKPSTPKKPSKHRGKLPVDEQGVAAPVKMLPEPKPPKALSKKEQAKLTKALLLKERMADADAMRINGVDDDTIEIPKKPWLTVFTGKRARPDEVAETLTDLASMLENGQTERKSVDELAVQYANYDIGQAYERVVMLMDRGVTLGAAMADQTDSFPSVVRELIGAAKMPKDMHHNLRQAAVNIIEGDNTKSQIKSALFKPGFMAFFLLVFTLAAIQWLLPMTAGMFAGIGAEIPQSTVIIMTVGSFLKWGLLALIILIFLGNAFWLLVGKNNERLATWADTLSLKAPLIGEIMSMSVAARFCDVLAAALGVGMSEIEALETASRACGNRALKRWVGEHVARQRIGIVAFSDVAKTDMLPWNFRNRIETTTSLTRRVEILLELADTFHAKAQQRLTRFADRVGPITEGIVVVVVIGVVMLIISPILGFVPTLIETIG